MPPPVYGNGSSILCYSIVTLHLDLLTRAFTSVPEHCRCKLGENLSNTLQDIVLTMFLDAHTDARTNRTKPLRLQPRYVGWTHKKLMEIQRRTRFSLTHTKWAQSEKQQDTGGVVWGTAESDDK